MSHVIHRSLRSTPIVASRAQGAYIFDAQGKPYLDACGGAAVSCLGHAHPDVLAAMHRQIDQLAYAHTSFFTSDVVEQLAEHLTRTAPGELNYAYFVSGGSEAIETALKMARQYFVEISHRAPDLSPVNRAITAIRWARWRWAVTNGAVASLPPY